MHDTNPVRGCSVSAPARLHLGFLDLNGGLGRRYGSIGLALEQPSTDIFIERASTSSASGPEQDRALTVLARCVEALKLKGHYRIEIKQAIPAHAGLGSGTQLALAIGLALMRLEGGELTPRQIGDLAGRGARSAIGMAAFDGGGFIVDGGRGKLDQPPPVLIQMPFPDAWRVLLVLDTRAQGAHGDRETRAFAALPPFPEALADRLCRLVLMQLVPGLKEVDIDTFGAALTEIQRIVGGHFAAAQDGSPWTSPAVGALLKRAAELGATGIGQTSWGPTGFGFVPSPDVADRLYHSLVGDAKAMGLEIAVVRGRNAGATIAADR
ncbi:beta-ribofuranosylaminobenzene 5'-phosphate synthase family protein [Hyphomicrobium sp. LHD-15]|uniref:beta-ribofuranosylaminobenzene 5'-phosphate synthase family protein n=1 Tax=Hyphomicrobium sp. LHD-15 TaxID=3072142 RepID=UPI00280E8737|nr:beta-ribofuranosylaminobenzene 5'-phosphate synthase family protein [Hyphomicrobium sp. LHD-15]MDQ8697392.1 GHMP kinase [Hyphomicrobium sp. LHD-15]